MPNTSASGGYLSPLVVSPPTEDIDLDAQFQAAVAGITGLEGQYVRPRWQSSLPKQPAAGVNWCAIGVSVVTPDDSPYISHIGAGEGADNYVRHEQIELACTFYGVNSQRYAATLRDGIAMPTNMSYLHLVGLYFIECSPVISAPELFNQQWIKRYDMTISFRRQVKRTYGVLNILSADPILVSDDIGIISNS